MPLLSLMPAEVWGTLSRVSQYKAAGPDSIPGRALRDCTDQMAGDLADISTFSLSKTPLSLPASVKNTTVIPAPQNSTVTGLNDYWLVARTPIMIKRFERLVKRHLHCSLSTSLLIIPIALQLMPSFILCTALSHLENMDTCQKTQHPPTCNWILRPADRETTVSAHGQCNIMDYQAECRCRVCGFNIIIMQVLPLSVSCYCNVNLAQFI